MANVWVKLALISAIAIVSAQPHADAQEAQGGARDISIVLTGQSLIINDIRMAGPAFDAMTPVLDADVVFTNFETTVREPGASIAELDPMSGVYAPPEALDALQEQGFNLIAFANNHIYDIGEVGITGTMTAANQRGLAHSGIGANLDEASAPGYLRTPRGVVALVSAASGYLHGRGRASATQPGLNELAIDGGDVVGPGGLDEQDAERILTQIRQARAHADIVILSHHNHVYDRPFYDLMMERSPDRLRPPAWVRAWARRAIDAGADVIVMHGAPFLQGVEIYNGKPIFYDVGNYIFQVAPQYVDLFGPLAGESAVVRVNFSGQELRGIALHPIVLDPRPNGEGASAEAARGLPSLAEGDEAATILQRVTDLSSELGTTLRITDGVAHVVLPNLN